MSWEKSADGVGYIHFETNKPKTIISIIVKNLILEKSNLENGF